MLKGPLGLTRLDLGGTDSYYLLPTKAPEEGLLARKEHPEDSPSEPAAISSAHLKKNKEMKKKEDGHDVSTGCQRPAEPHKGATFPHPSSSAPQTGKNKAPQPVAEMTRLQEHAGVALGTMSSTVRAAQNNLLRRHGEREEIPRGTWRPRARLGRGGWEAQGMCHPSSQDRATSLVTPLLSPQHQNPVSCGVPFSHTSAYFDLAASAMPREIWRLSL